MIRQILNKSLLQQTYLKQNFTKPQQYYKFWHNGKIDLSLIPKKELKFKNYKLNEGYQKIKFGILGINLTVFGLWIASQEDLELSDFMNNYFLWKNTNYRDIDGKTEFNYNFITYLTSSFSHQSLPHISGNMFLFWMLARRLHQFLGTAKFLLLYIGGGLSGSIATAACQQYKPENVQKHNGQRSLNILQGQYSGYQASLGASDSVMSMIAAFYLIFPRHNVYASKVAYFLKIKKLKVSAIWLLPFYFLNDFVTLGYNQKSTSSTNNYAHLGGFAWGSLFYALIARPLKNKHHHVQGVDVRKFYLLFISLSVWTVLLLLLESEKSKNEEKIMLKINTEQIKEFCDQKSFKINEEKQKIIHQTIKEYQDNQSGLRKLLFPSQIRNQDYVTGQEIYNSVKEAQNCVSTQIFKKQYDDYAKCDRQYYEINQKLNLLEREDKFKVLKTIEAAAEFVQFNEDQLQKDIIESLNKKNIE